MTLGIINDKAEYEIIEVSLTKQDISEASYDESFGKNGKDNSLFFIDLHTKIEFDYINKMICLDYGFHAITDTYNVRFVIDALDNVELIFSGKFGNGYRWYDNEEIDCWLTNDEKLLVKGICLRKLLECF